MYQTCFAALCAPLVVGFKAALLPPAICPEFQTRSNLSVLNSLCVTAGEGQYIASAPTVVAARVLQTLLQLHCVVRIVAELQNFAPALLFSVASVRSIHWT